MLYYLLPGLLYALWRRCNLNNIYMRCCQKRKIIWIKKSSTWSVSSTPHKVILRGDASRNSFNHLYCERQFPPQIGKHFGVLSIHHLLSLCTHILDERLDMAAHRIEKWCFYLSENVVWRKMRNWWGWCVTLHFQSTFESLNLFCTGSCTFFKL